MRVFRVQSATCSLADTMKYQYLDTIQSPDDLKQLPQQALPVVCNELRDFIIRELSHNPGHLASSLGSIELTVALHYVFHTPEDRLIWDVGHQAYAHKILTGRRERFHTNRQFKGLAPFPTPVESAYDAFVAGHASNSISAALGIEIAGRVQNKDRHVVAIIGDGSMTGGLAFEGLNNTSMDQNDMLIVLNDNHIAIDPLKGGFTQYLVDLTTGEKYNRWRWNIYSWLRRHRLLSETKTGWLRSVINNVKILLTRQTNNIFRGLNIRYFGPTDGHNVLELVRILSEIKNYKGPKVLHIVTKKGKGYEPAEHDQTTWHAPGLFNPDNGKREMPSEQMKTTPLWQHVFGQTLLEMARQTPNIIGVTPAMPSGCSMTIMQQQMPERVFDVGIAEGHAVTFSAGMAKEGLLPFCNVYSSFLQRAYDNIVHDVALLNLHVVLCVDRAGIVGNDGATHHGILDLAYLRSIPNMQLCAPRTADDLVQMMHLAETLSGPVAIRYPRGKIPEPIDGTSSKVEYGKGVPLRTKGHIAVLTIGSIGNAVAEALQQIQQPIAHYDMRWVKPLDTALLDEIVQHVDTLVTVEDGVINGGFGSAVAEYVADKPIRPRVIRWGIPDCFVEHGSTAELYQMLRLDAEGLKERLITLLKETENYG